MKKNPHSRERNRKITAAFILMLACGLAVLSAIAAPYPVIQDFYEDLARMRKDDQYGFIDKRGNWIIEPAFAEAYSFSDGLCVVKNNSGETLVLNKDGQPAFPFPAQYWISPHNARYSEGLLGVYRYWNRSGVDYFTAEYMDTQGKIVLPNSGAGIYYKSVDEFSEGYAHVQVYRSVDLLDGRNPYDMDLYYDAYIDTEGNETVNVTRLIRIPWNRSKGFSCAPMLDGYAVVSAAEDPDRYKEETEVMYTIIDKTGHICYSVKCREYKMQHTIGTVTFSTSPRDAIVINCGDGIFAVFNQMDDTVYFIDAFGKRIIAETFHNPFEEKWVMRTGANADLNKYCFSDGLALVGTDYKGRIVPCYIDTQGNVIIREKWSDAKAFSEGLAAVCSNGKWGYINTNGKYVIEPKYDSVRSFCNGAAVVDLGDEWYIIDTAGNVLY